MHSQLTLSIVIPAYNEEANIASILKRTLDARARLLKVPGIGEVEVILVDDGSTDKTAELAKIIDGVRLIRHPKNLGYGAALKTGFQAARGEMLGFLDADGTCDPEEFSHLARALREEEADLCVGSRLHKGSHMPRVRVMGNLLYAKVINTLVGSRITDSASGMRIFRRDVLTRLRPLPDGMNFTPAFSARALSDPRIRVIERPIRYEERVGESKLRILQDGYYFLRVILEVILSYKPLEFFGTLGCLMMGVAVGYAVNPILYYMSHRRLEEYMVYRFLTILVLVTASTIALVIGTLAQKASNLAARRDAFSRWTKGLDRVSVPAGALFLSLGIGLNNQTILQYVLTRTIRTHWIYVLTGGILVLVGLTLLCYSIASRLLSKLSESVESPV